MKNNEWKECYTLGGKSKHFCWKYEEKNQLDIKRQFKNTNRGVEHSIPYKKLCEIQEYVLRNSDEGTDLANNIEKLALGTEKEGLGKFMYKLFDENVIYGQLASHVAALFVGAGIWKKTRKDAKRSIRLEVVPNKENWQVLLYTFYCGSSNCDKEAV